MDSDESIGTVRWFGPTWGAPINDPRAEISVPLGENCIACEEAFDHGDEGVAIAASVEIAENGQVFYHRWCFFEELGIPKYTKVGSKEYSVPDLEAGNFVERRGGDFDGYQ